MTKEKVGVIMNYPPTKRIPKREIIHGIEITDNYQWLEKWQTPEVKRWIYKQNLFTRSILDNLPERDEIKKRLLELHPHGIVSTPVERDLGWFYLRREREENQAKLCFLPINGETEEIVLVNPNELDPKGLTTIDWFFPSNDGKFVAYGLSQGGDEWSILHVIDVMKEKLLSESIPRTRFCTVRWKNDNSGFYYTRYPDFGDVPPCEVFYHQHVRYHRLGDPHQDDVIIFKNERNPREFPHPFLSPDESYMLIMSYRFVSADLYHVDLTTTPPRVNPIIENNEWMIKKIEITRRHVYLLATKDSPEYILYRTTKDRLDPIHWEKLVIPPEGATLEDFVILKDKIISLLQKEVSHHLYQYDHEGSTTTYIKLPELGTVLDLKGTEKTTRTSFIFHSFFYPPRPYMFDTRTQQLEMLESPSIQVNSEVFQVTKVWYSSRDGTKIHMYIYHKKNLVRDGKNPTILYGYGGFGISLLPSYSPFFFHWVEKGGVVAVANIRGGGEFGEKWHEDGRLDKKQNTFDDFISAAEYLISQNYCSPRTLGIMGGSNGGLLVGAVMTQKPHLFAAVYCGVPLLDMVRYHKFSMAKVWITEYGDPENPEHFKWLYSYSPYHNVKDGESYPAVLFHAAESDSRVDPSHAMKMTALLQHASKSKNPILLHIESEAGHGAGKPVEKRIKQFVDMLSFFWWRLALLPSDAQ